MKICEYCGAEFKTSKSNQKYCSRKCNQESYKAHQRMVYVGKRESACVICVQPLPKFKTRYCSDGCRRQANIVRAGKGDEHPHGLLTKICTVCGREFQTYKSRQLTCSADCSEERRKQLGNERNRKRYAKKARAAGIRSMEDIHAQSLERKTQIAAERAVRQEERQKEINARREERARIKAENIAYWQNFRERRICECCGEEYIAKHPLSKYCSDKCGRQFRKQQRKDRYAGIMADKNITLKRLAKRDGDICQICGERVDWFDKIRTEKTVICGDMYPSIDHIYPISKGGVHSWDNVQLAHRKCNTLKRDSIA